MAQPETGEHERSATQGRRPPGSTDVARLAGVSQKTVSRVFNDERYVSESVRDRVLTAARQLGYRPNGAARALNSGRTQRLGVISLGSALYGPSSLLMGIEQRARQLGYGVSVVTTDEGDNAGISRAVETLLTQGVDGIVISEPIDQGHLELDIDVPVLTLGSFPGLHAPMVVAGGADATAASSDATEYLLELGHPTVHHVAGPQRWYAARERLTGWRQALERAGIEAPQPLEGDWSCASGYRAARDLLAQQPVTAIFVGNDDMAIGVIRALVEAGLDVPEDVSVVGFDDIPSAEYINPPLTTVSAQHGHFAERGLDALVGAIEGTSPSGPDEEAGDVFRLIVRASTGAPPMSISPPAGSRPSDVDAPGPHHGRR